MSKSGTPNLSDQIECLFRHFPILCRECGHRIAWDEERDWDHLIEEADGGEHAPVNFRPIHSKSIGCHRRKSARKEAERHHIDRLERVKLGLPKRKRPKKKLPAKQDHKWSKKKLHSAPWRGIGGWGEQSQPRGVQPRSIVSDQRRP